MSLLAWRACIPAVNAALLAVLFFLIPTQITPACILSAVLLALWVIGGRRREVKRFAYLAIRAPGRA